MAEQRLTVTSSGSFRVATWLAEPDRARAVIVLCHGLTTGADDGGPFLPLRDRLVDRGFAVYRFDARCHGETGGGWLSLSLSGWRDDVAAVISEARKSHPGLPLMLLGASFAGGPVIAAADADGGIAAIALWSPVLDYRETFLSATHPAGAAVLATGSHPGLPEWAALSIPWADVAFSPALVDEFRADRTTAILASLGTPVRIFHGAGDPFVPVGLSRAAEAASPSVSVRVYPFARHGFRGMHWLVRRETVRWLDTHR